MLGIGWDGRRIEGEVSVTSCEVRLRLGGFADGATVRMADAEGRWESWGSAPGSAVDLYWDDRPLLRGTLSGFAVAPGVRELEVVGRPEGSETALASRVFDDSLRGVLSTVCGLFGAKTAFYGDFSAPVRGFVASHERPMDVLGRLSGLFGFWFVGQRDRVDFVSQAYLDAVQPSRTVRLDASWEHGFSASRPLGRLTMTNGAAEASASDPAGYGWAVEVYHGQADEGGLRTMAEAALRRRNLGAMSFSLTLPSLDGGLVFPGETLRLETAAAGLSGTYLVTGADVSVTRGTERLKGVRLA